MSDGMNKVILLGNLGADPELRYTNAGAAVLSFRVATKETWVDKNRELQERTEWHTVVIFGPRAEGLARYLGKGSSVLIEGGLRTSSYEKDGQKRYKTEVHARDVLLLGRRATPVGSDAGGSPAPASPLPGSMLPPPVRAPLPGGGPAEGVDELPY